MLTTDRGKRAALEVRIHGRSSRDDGGHWHLHPKATKVVLLSLGTQTGAGHAIRSAFGAAEQSQHE